MWIKVHYKCFWVDQVFFWCGNNFWLDDPSLNVFAILTRDWSESYENTIQSQGELFDCTCSKKHSPNCKSHLEAHEIILPQFKWEKKRPIFPPGRLAEEHMFCGTFALSGSAPPPVNRPLIIVEPNERAPLQFAFIRGKLLHFPAGGGEASEKVVLANCRFFRFFFQCNQN